MISLADLGGGNWAFQDPKNTPAEKASATSHRNFFFGADLSKSLDRKWATDVDLYAAFTTLLLLLTRKQSKSVLD